MMVSRKVAQATTRLPRDDLPWQIILRGGPSENRTRDSTMRMLRDTTLL